MSTRSWIILILLVILNIAGYLASLSKTPPGIRTVKNNPSAFHLDDYPDKISLHTRLSTLFPRGSTAKNVQDFMSAANIPQLSANSAACFLTLHYNKIEFYFDKMNQHLVAIQVETEKGDQWPFFNTQCKGPTPIQQPKPTAQHAQTKQMHDQSLTPDFKANNAEKPFTVPLQPLE